MRRIISTYNKLHLGDNLIHLNYLYRLIKLYPEKYDFHHYLNEDYIDSLGDLIKDCKNIKLMSLKDLPQDAVNCWIGYEDYFYKSPLARNWTAFHLDYFNYLSNKLGLKNPISHRDDLLFNFPLLDGPSPINKKFDFLIVNSMPLSGQIAGFDPNFLNVLIKTLVFKGYSVISTHPNGIVESTMERGFNLLDIARISNYSKVIIGVPNGPMWLTFNIFNNDNLVLRLPWVSIQDLNLGKNCKTCYESLEIYNLLQLNKII